MESHVDQREDAASAGETSTTWKWHRTLEKHDASTAAAYPSVIESRDGTILCAYTHSPSPNETIKVVRFNEDWVRAGDAAE